MSCSAAIRDEDDSFDFEEESQTSRLPLSSVAGHHNANPLTQQILKPRACSKITKCITIERTMAQSIHGQSPPDQQRDCVDSSGSSCPSDSSVLTAEGDENVSFAPYQPTLTQEIRDNLEALCIVLREAPYDLEPRLSLNLRLNKKKTVLLDLDETLVHTQVAVFSEPASECETKHIPAGSLLGNQFPFHITLRPQARQFLAALAPLYNIIVCAINLKPFIDLYLQLQGVRPRSRQVLGPAWTLPYCSLVAGTLCD